MEDNLQDIQQRAELAVFFADDAVGNALAEGDVDAAWCKEREAYRNALADIARGNLSDPSKVAELALRIGETYFGRARR